MSWAFALIGLSVANAGSAQAAAFPLIAPLVFAFSAFVPVQSMPGWLQALAKHQPVSAAIDATRALMLGGPTTSIVLQSLVGPPGSSRSSHTRRDAVPPYRLSSRPAGSAPSLRQALPVRVRVNRLQPIRCGVNAGDVVVNAVRNFSQAAVARRLGPLGAAALGEVGGLCMSPGVHAIWSGASICAPAYTVLCAEEDNLALHAAVARASREHALVVATSGGTANGYFGEILATAALVRQLSGLVIDAAVRDVDALRRLSFSVFAAGVALPGTRKQGPGTTGGPVELAGVRVEQGDWVVADSDGVVVVPQAKLQEVLEAGEERVAKEAAMLAALRAGLTTLELLELDDTVVSNVARDDHGTPSRGSWTSDPQPDRTDEHD